MDTVGFAHTVEQMDEVLAQRRELAAPRIEELEGLYGWEGEAPFIAGVCPHDDYYYAGRLYALLLPHIRAKRVIIFGVFHRARTFGLRDKLVFNRFKFWRGSYGPVKVSPLREEILKRLPEGDYAADNEMQTVEHSVEAIVNFLQSYNREVEIVSILVPYIDWGRMEELSVRLAGALAEIFQEKGWILGEDVAIICSADAVHYGDAGWGGRNYADFGCDIQGYRKAVERDTELTEQCLCGPVTSEKLRHFLHTCADSADITNYKITWCGRFSIPLGLSVASRLVQALEGRILEGFLLDYGTSVSEASLDLDKLEGMGATAPNNLHHWVGYPAIGYK